MYSKFLFYILFQLHNISKATKSSIYPLLKLPTPFQNFRAPPPSPATFTIHTTFTEDFSDTCLQNILVNDIFLYEMGGGADYDDCTSYKILYSRVYIFKIGYSLIVFLKYVLRLSAF